MKIKSFQGGYDKNLSYLIWCDKTKYAAIIDPAVNPMRALEYIEDSELVLSKIIITHSHYDHIKYLEDYIYKYPNIQICCHDKSDSIYHANNVRKIENNEIIMLGEVLMIAIYTPGHYYDSICYWLNRIFLRKE